jgi:magnesium transporter
MTTDYMWIFPHRTVTATIAKIREVGPKSEFIYCLYVTDERHKLLGVLSLRTLLLACRPASSKSSCAPTSSAQRRTPAPRTSPR